jgi:hypothetical protein
MPDRSETDILTRALGPEASSFVFDHLPDGWENRAECDRAIVLLQGRATERLADADRDVRQSARALRHDAVRLWHSLKERARVRRDVKPFLPRRGG